MSDEAVAAKADEAEFAAFVAEAEPLLRAALAGRCGANGAHDAVAEALAYAWEHWAEVQAVDNRIGYLYRVAQSKTRQRKQGLLPEPADVDLPDLDPGLIPALRGLPDMQRTAVWLVTACGWTQPEAAAAMGVSSSTVSTHVQRGLQRLRDELGATADA